MIDFELPNELIAQEPASPRDHAKLLIFDRSNKKITDDHFFNIKKYLPKNTTLVLNNSKVEECRYLFDDGKTELFILNKLDTHTVTALVRPGRRFKAGSHLSLTSWLNVEVLSVDDEGIRTMRLSVAHDDARLHKYRHIPLPPYIAQDDSLKLEYQTVYAKPIGSKAAPTAGLHFTKELLKEIGKTNSIAELTLHVGLGTFAKLTQKNLQSNRLHSEWYNLDASTANILENAKSITAVGTTTVRTLESIMNANGRFVESSAATDIFIKPGYKFRAVNSLITNFHLPQTSLLLLVEAFVGSESELSRIYAHAIAKKYRFYSFGDAMLVL